MIRDIGCFVLGIAGIVYQQITGKVDTVLLVVYLTLLGVPGLLGAIAIGRGTDDGPEPPSSRPAQHSSPPRSQSQPGRPSDE
jgi:hypothetical protein